MSTVYLYVDGDEDWKEFDLSDKEELEKRNIWIGSGVKIGNVVKIGKRARIV
ncbi:hypothetical protein LEP1GSC126_0068 [Leptospira kirschneri str. 200801774]|uniref:hypothetical protein n=1 Tax=Leptospira kirschneri TaxID=29507 RepID=UPI0002BFB100|nr:hypothetical protein [Leptospira kirschneri]EMO78563.1 hypothetical protein LEP1GSC126_0068 [Leptospira kirschneri str. 200801774]